jgi:hypothetical protein
MAAMLRVRPLQPLTRPCRGWQTDGAHPRSKLTDALQSELIFYKREMASREAANPTLRRLIDSLTNRMDPDGFLSVHFHDMTCCLTLRINDAFDCLCDLEKSVRSRRLM